MSLSTGLVSYWKLDEASGNAADSVGSNTATNTNATYAAGKINNGANFNGTSAKFTNALAIPSTDFSFSFWVKPNGIGTAQALITKDVDVSNRAIDFYLETTGVVQIYAWNSSGTIYSCATTVLTDAVWHHIVVVWDSTLNKLIPYLNGKIGTSATTTGTPKDLANNLEFGHREFTSSPLWYAGSLDEIGVWSRVLTLQEIQVLYRFGNANQYPFKEQDSNFFNIF